MACDLIPRRILHPSDSVLKEMCRHQTIYGLPKNCPKQIHKTPRTICYTAKLTTINKFTTVDTSNLQPGELVHVDFEFYNVTSIHSFTPMLTVVCAKTIMLWLFPTVSKISPV